MVEGVVDYQGDPNNPTTIMTTTPQGRVIDLANCPGSLKREMIETGEMEIDRFVTPPNCPGPKLAAMRKAHRDEYEKVLKPDKTVENPFVIGDMVKSDKGKIYEALEVSPEKGVKVAIPQKGGTVKDVWIHHSRLKKA